MIYDVEQLTNSINDEVEKVENADTTPVVGRLTTNGKEVFVDLLAFEFDPDSGILYLNLGPRR